MNLVYQNLVDLSVVIAMFVAIWIFLILSESRYPKKVYLASLIPCMTLWFGVNIGILLICGLEVQGRYTLFTATLPSLLYFWIVAKNRGGRFFFTFCLADTVTIWVMMTTNLIDYAVGGQGQVLFVLRMLSFPVLLAAMWRLARRPYLRLLNTVKRGWWLFAAMTGLFYMTLLIMTGIPTNLRLRPDDIPSAVMVLILLPLTYVTIFRVLLQQEQLFESKERQRTFAAQTAMIEQRAQEIRRMEERLRIERHDLRHRLQTVAAMVRRDDKEGVLNYIGMAQELLDGTDAGHYCTNAVLDAILSTYFRQAEELGIRVEASLAIPDELPAPAAELSTVFANALENMIHAVRDLPEAERRIVCKAVTEPRLILEFANPCPVGVKLGPDGIPVAAQSGHGQGTRSIVAFAEKHSAVYTFRVEDGWFKLQLAL
ncbi:MAG: GHKL domain-containing protein [Oscillospiraceae bacterium]|nr:GHKL domain-containing protein [Oscillospiraceae bacterium]